MIQSLPPATVRSRIMDNLRDRFLASKAGVSGSFVTWNTVATRPLGKTNKQLGDAISIYSTRERKVAETGYHRCTLQINVEFVIKTAAGDDVSEVASLVLGEVQTLLLSDIYCGGLSLHVVEVGNELDMEGPNGTEVSGIVFIEVLYRHRANQPRKLIGE